MMDLHWGSQCACKCVDDSFVSRHVPHPLVQKGTLSIQVGVVSGYETMLTEVETFHKSLFLNDVSVAYRALAPSQL